MARGTIITLTGTRGAGKSSIAARLLKLLPGSQLVTSVTTRTPRPSDLPNEYRYVAPDLFNVVLRHQPCLWERTISGNRYATTRESVTEILVSSKRIGIMILVLDTVEELDMFIQGYAGGSHPLVPIFIHRPSIEVLRERIAVRNEDPAKYEESWREDETLLDRAVASRVRFLSVENPQGALDATTSHIATLAKDRIEANMGVDDRLSLRHRRRG